jgi:alcohol dehydrogenase (NADP+)
VNIVKKVFSFVEQTRLISGREQYCDRGQIGTYNGVYKDGSKSYGGYADYARVPSHFVVKIPESIPSEMAAPMLCGGVTVYSPIKENGAAPGKTVGIVGIGGLGHFGLIFAKALGAEVVAISHTESKKADAEKMGASKFISTSKGKSVFKENARTMDFIGILSIIDSRLISSLHSQLT